MLYIDWAYCIFVFMNIYTDTDTDTDTGIDIFSLSLEFCSVLPAQLLAVRPNQIQL